MKFFDYLLEQPFLFNLSQLPFTKQKFARILRHNDLSSVQRVLDVGCGPGTNAPSFAHAAAYQGIDINPRYIEMARRRYRREFLVADMTKYQVDARDAYDFILINSFLHHVDTDSVHRILASTPRLLAPGGHVHSIEVVLPTEPGLSRLLARWDRGGFARPVEEWQSIFGKHLETVIFEPFAVVHLGHPIMEMVYFKGKVN